MLDDWRREVSAALNSHDAAIEKLTARLTPRMTIGETALALALWLTEESEDGFSRPVSFEKIRDAFPERTKGDMEEACFELQHLGVVKCEGAIGRPVLTVRPNYQLFWTFDPTVRGSDPRKDASELAKLILTDEGLAIVSRLQDAAGWDRRRLNPAVAYLQSKFPRGRYSEEIQNKYPTTQFIVTSQERFQLKQFARAEE